MFASVVQCGPDAIGVRVHVIGVTPDIHYLHANTVLDGKPAMQGAEFTQQLSQFTIKVPTSAIEAGQLVINVAGLGIDHCKLSAGRTDILVSEDTPYAEKEVNLVFLPSKLCTQLNQITPSTGPSEGGTMLQLDGQNFAEGATVTIDGVPATNVAIMDSGRLMAVSPARPGAFGRVPVVVSTPDGQSVSRNDLFAYYAKRLDFSMATFPAGNAQSSLAVGDLNGDKKLDLAVANRSNNNVSVLLGNGLGSLGPAKNFAVDLGPTSVSVGDFNADGSPDLAVANATPNNLSVLLNDGTGTGGFGVAKNTMLSTAPGMGIMAAVGDFNGDRRPDLALANQGSKLDVLLGNGMGGWSLMNYPVASQPVSVSVGDFNADGKSDLATANVVGNVSILLGNGSGGFATPVDFPAGSGSESVAVGDFNGDMKTDLAVANWNDDNVSVLLGNGLGGFAAAVNFSVGDFPTTLVVGDFNGDLKLDLAVTNYFGHSVSVLLGNGLGGFAAPANFPVNSTPSSMAMGDFNGDQKPDLAVTYSGGVAILTNMSQ